MSMYSNGDDDDHGQALPEPYGDQWWPPDVQAGNIPQPPPGWRPKPPPGWASKPGFYDWYFYWGYRLRNAWRDIKFLREVTRDLIAEEIQRKIEDGTLAGGGTITEPGNGNGGGSITNVGSNTTVGPNPPKSPNPGDQWWDTAENLMRVWTGTAWELVSTSGAGPVQTTTRVFAVGVGTNLTMPANQWSIVPIAAPPLYDTLEGWDPTSRQYTPTKQGQYLCFTSSYLGNAQGTAGHFLIKNDGGTYNPSSQEVVTNTIGAGSTSFQEYLTASGIVFMNGTTDSLRLWGLTANGLFFAAFQPAFQAFLLP